MTHFVREESAARRRDTPRSQHKAHTGWVCCRVLPLPRKVDGNGAVAGPTVTLKRSQGVCEVACYPAALFFAKLCPGRAQDTAVSFVLGDGRFVFMTRQALGDWFSLANVEGGLARPVGVLGPDDVHPSLRQRVVVEFEAEEVTLVAVVTTCRP
jgi:hypothetical protein